MGFGLLLGLGGLAVAGASWLLVENDKKPKAKSPGTVSSGKPPVGKMSERELSTVKFWNGFGWVYALKESLLPMAYNALANYYVTSESIGTVGVKVWTCSPRDASDPENSDFAATLAKWKKQGWSVLASWTFPYPMNTVKTIQLVPPEVNPWYLDTTGECVVYFAAPAWGVPSVQITQDPKKPIDIPGKEIDPSLDDVDDDIDEDKLPPDSKDAIADVFRRGHPFEMDATAHALHEGGYEEAAVWMKKWAQKARASRLVKAAANSGFDYLLRDGELPPFYFTEAWLGKGQGLRYSEIVNINSGKLKQSKKGVDGWNAGTTILTPQKWGDPYDRPPLPCKNGNSPGGSSGQGSGGVSSGNVPADFPQPTPWGVYIKGHPLPPGVSLTRGVGMVPFTTMDGTVLYGPDTGQMPQGFPQPTPWGIYIAGKPLPPGVSMSPGVGLVPFTTMDGTTLYGPPGPASTSGPSEEDGLEFMRRYTGA